MTRLTAPALLAAFALAATAPLAAQAATKKPVHKAPVAKKAAEPEAPEVMTDGQLAAAQRVFTGKAECEMKQTVDLEAVDGQPGHFTLKYGKQTYHMTPEETTTGAVRLHDKKADVIWIQIPAKSMLLDEKAGHRMVDGCTEEQQRTASAGGSATAAH
jgi:hypothetical protein